MNLPSMPAESGTNEATEVLPHRPPFIWPEARYHAGLAKYAEMPPAADIFTHADLIGGVLVGVADGTVEWLRALLQGEPERRVRLVLVVYPTCPTREEHLRAIHDLQAMVNKESAVLEVRILPMELQYGGSCARIPLPPTVLQAHSTATDQTTMSIGSVGDLGHDRTFTGSLNLVFRPDDAVRDSWRNWFEFVRTIAAPLTEDTVRVPRLVPAKGSQEAAVLWRKFEDACRKPASADETSVEVNPETGEVVKDAEGNSVDAWDGGQTALDPLGQLLQGVYAEGWLVTVDEATRIKPLTIPVKAKLLGQQSERTVGSVRQKQSFSLQVLTTEITKAIEKCRKVTDVIDLLSFPLSKGNRWLPGAARDLLEKELEARNEQGRKLLIEAIGGETTPSGEGPDSPESGTDAREGWAAKVKAFVATKTERIRRDLDEMYRQLGQGDAVPGDRFRDILDDVEARLRQALESRITPRTVYNRIDPPSLAAASPDENWGQPFSLLLRSARMFRKLRSDPYFPRRFSGLAFTENDYTKACDAFGDTILEKEGRGHAEAELDALQEISTGQFPARTRCQQVWSVIRGKKPDEDGHHPPGEIQPDLPDVLCVADETPRGKAPSL